MLDKATWEKTILNLNVQKSVNAIAVFSCTKRESNPAPKVHLINTVSTQFLSYAQFLIKLFYFLLEQTLSAKRTVIFFDVYTYPLIPLLKIFRGKKCKYYIDYRTFYFNFNEESKLSFRDQIMKALTVFSFRYAKRRKIGLSLIVEEMKNFINQYINIEEMNILIWGSGVQPDDFIISNNILATYTKKLSLPENSIIFIYHGHLTKNRGLSNVIDALSQIKNLFNIRFLIIGDGPEKNILLKKIESLELSKECIFLGRIPYLEIKYYIALSDIALMIYPNIPYWNYNNPIKFSEYMILNKYIIATKIKSFTKMMLNSNGKMIETNEISVIIKALQDCCVRIKEIRINYKDSRSYILENYTWEKQANKIMQNINSR